MLLNCKLVQQDLVISLIEVVQKLKFVIHSSSHAFDLFDLKIWNFLGKLITLLIERQNFLFLRFKFSTELSSFQNFLAELLVALKSVHASLGVHGEITKSLLLFVSCKSHSLLEVMVVLNDLVSFSLNSLVSFVTLFLVLLNFQIQECGLLLQSAD